MGYIPKGAKWYIADLIQEFKIEGEEENVVHIDTTLIRADSPEEAYDKALALGREGQDDGSYKNPYNKLVTILFRGLRDLNVVDGELEDGTELLFERRDSLSEEEMKGLVRGKDQLNVFTPTESYIYDPELDPDAEQ